MHMFEILASIVKCMFWSCLRHVCVMFASHGVFCRVWSMLQQKVSLLKFGQTSIPPGEIPRMVRIFLASGNQLDLDVSLNF